MAHNLLSARTLGGLWRSGGADKKRDGHSFSEVDESDHIRSILLFPRSSPPAVNRRYLWVSRRRFPVLFFPFLSLLCQIQLDPQGRNYLSFRFRLTPLLLLHLLPLLIHFTDESICPGCPGSSHGNISYQSSPSKNSSLYHNASTSTPLTHPTGCWSNCKVKVNHILSCKLVCVIVLTFLFPEEVRLNAGEGSRLFSDKNRPEGVMIQCAVQRRTK